MRSFYIITGGILVMIAVVFLAPQKQSKTEETASSQRDEIDAYILKEYGNVLENLSPEEKELARQDIAARLAREKAEMRKYGRLLTADERSEQWWKEQDEAEEKAAYTKLYEEWKEWIDNFPFRRGYHPDIVFEPENIAHSNEKFHAYQKELEKKGSELWHERGEKSRAIWARTDLSLEEKHAADDKLWQEMEAAREPDPEIMAERRIIMRHKRLAGFYKQHYRYLPEFEQAYRIFEEEGAGDNPVQIADTMASLEMHKEASKHDPEELHQHFRGSIEGKKGNHPYTNQQFLDRSFH